MPPSAIRKRKASRRRAANSPIESDARHGFSLIELMVVLGTLAILLALTLPAVQMAREASRRLGCLNNLHQIGIAITNYDSSNGQLPPFSAFSGSPWIRLQAFLDMPELPPPSGMSRSNHEKSLRVGVLTCPSEAGQAAFGANYAFNSGARTKGAYDGPFAWLLTGRLSSITDGLSQTALMSEWIKGTNDPLVVGMVNRSEPRALIFNLLPGSGNPNDYAAIAEQCRTLNPETAYVFDTDKGLYWMNAAPWYCAYDHAVPPNGFSCTNANSNLAGMLTAGSFHSGGVHVLLADGAVRFVATTINSDTWRALGTRAGREVITDF